MVKIINRVKCGLPIVNEGSVVNSSKFASTGGVSKSDNMSFASNMGYFL